MARCPDCNRFVSYDEDAEPEVDCEDIEEDGSYSVSIRRVLPCGECGTELKEALFDFSGDFELPWSDDEHVEPVCPKCGHEVMTERQVVRDGALVTVWDCMECDFGDYHDAEWRASEAGLKALQGIRSSHELELEVECSPSSRTQGRGRGMRTHYGVEVSIIAKCTCGCGWESDTVYESQDEQASYMDDLT